MSSNATAKRRRDANVALGLCARCGQHVVEGKRECKYHREKRIAVNRRYYYKNKHNRAGQSLDEELRKKRAAWLD